MSSPVGSTAIQVASRVFITDVCVEVARVYNSPQYAILLVAWGLADTIRYLFYTAQLVFGANRVPGILRWIRYNAFMILYPVGAGCEWLLMRESWKVLKGDAPAWNYLFIFLMVIWGPGLALMLSHMLRQRARAYSRLSTRPTPSK